MNADQLTIAEAARDEAVDRVERHADPEWKVKALDAVRAIASARPYFTTDDVWDRVGAPPEPRALGAVMRQAARLGIAKASDRTQKSKRPECHARPVRVWVSR